ncbi:ABC transporter ATP-binding protein [Desulfosarcina widdelii]|uniref:ABC transporter ATP-binding protein n=1 Tax=Desulfosarcina widdelii TaxID=947919 RepID=A0A5K7Z4Y3_9BACT|nr:ATP-binding cassette domain-containing protein [Desulfosarcina widdelii]BBO75760.1 ABC transporter ATP-binding protein [Desulfosarcina widdelii]
MDDKTPVIAFSKVTFSYPNGKVLFQDLSLELAGGSFYLVHGPSGSGKSTFLRLINRLEEPSLGQLMFEGRPLTSYNPPLLRREVLYIQQTPTSVDATVRENLLLAFSFKNNRDLTPPDDDILKSRLDNFLLNDIRLDTHASTLSVGQLQRLCFIRGLLLNPKVLLLDEPASALDEESARIVEETAERMCVESGLTVLMVSHRTFRPARVRHKVLQIVKGQIELLT